MARDWRSVRGRSASDRYSRGRCTRTRSSCSHRSRTRVRGPRREGRTLRRSPRSRRSRSHRQLAAQPLALLQRDELPPRGLPPQQQEPLRTNVHALPPRPTRSLPLAVHPPSRPTGEEPTRPPWGAPRVEDGPDQAPPSHPATPPPTRGPPRAPATGSPRAPFRSERIELGLAGAQPERVAHRHDPRPVEVVLLAPPHRRRYEPPIARRGRERPTPKRETPTRRGYRSGRAAGAAHQRGVPNQAVVDVAEATDPTVCSNASRCTRSGRTSW